MLGTPVPSPRVLVYNFTNYAMLLQEQSPRSLFVYQIIFNKTH